MALRCLIITYYFPPLGGGGVQRLTKLVKYLSQLGWQITVITADEDSDLVPSDPSLLKQVPKTVRVARIPGINLHVPQGKEIQTSSFFKRWLSAFLYIPDIRKKWLPELRKIVRDELEHTDYNCIIVSIPPYSLGILAMELTQKYKIPVILDMRDPWTKNPYKIHPTPIHQFIDQLMESKVISNVSYGTSAYQSLIDYYKQNIKGFDASQWHHAPNGYDESDFQGLEPLQNDLNLFHIGFSGTFYSHINQPESLFRAISWLKEKKPGIAKKIRFHHVGKSMISLNRIARKFDVEFCLQSWGYKPHNECLKILSGMNALFFTLDEKDHRAVYTVGGKVYEYLRLKKPILAVVPAGGEAAKLVENTDSGIVIPGNQTVKIAQTLEKWIKAEIKFNFSNITMYERKTLAENYHRFLLKLIDS